MIRLITITSIILSLFLTALAQSGGSLTGRIVSTDGNALAGISVSLEETPFTATTDPNGRFSFNNVPAGRYVLVISGGGFVPQTHDVEIKAGETASIDGRLYKITASIDVVASLAEYHLEETSSATKTATRLIDLPQSVQVFPNQLIEDRAITEGNELFRNISGLNQSTYSAMVFRGFTEREILYNGARGNPFGSLEGDVNNSGFSTSQIRLTNIQRVEVLKGPTAALYGSGEPGGLINYVTKKPKETLDAEIQLRLGSFGQKMVSGDITGPATDSLLYRGAFYFEDRDSFRFNAGARNYHTAGNLTWRLNDRAGWNFEYEFIKQVLPGHRLRGVPVDSSGKFLTRIEWTATEPSDFIKLDAHIFQFRGDHDFGRDWKLDYTLRYLDYERAENYHEPRGLNPATPTGRTMQREFRDQFRSNQDWSVVANLSKPLSLGNAGIHRMLFGAEYAAQDHIFRFATARQRELGGPVPAIDLFNPVYGQTRGSDYGLKPGNFLTDSATTGRGGFYAQDQISLGRFLQLVFSGRVDHYHDKGFSGGPLRGEETALSGRAGAVFKPVEQLALYGSYANSFIRPGILSQTPAANGPHNPETGDQIEFGAKAELLNKRLFVTAAIFQINKENILRPDPKNGPSGRNFNAVLGTGAARSRGFEFDIEGFLTRAWYAALSYTHLDTRITRDNTASLIGKKLPNAAPNTLGLFTRYNFLESTGVGLGLEGVGDRVEPFAGIRAPGYKVVDLSFYQNLTKMARLQVQVTNLFDEKYAVSSLFASRAGNFPGQPRAVSVTLAVTPFRSK